MNIDITVYKDGFHGDTSQTFLVGDVVSLFFLDFIDILDLWVNSNRMRKDKNLCASHEIVSKQEYQPAALADPSKASQKPSMSIFAGVIFACRLSSLDMGSAKNSIDHLGYCITVR